MDYRDDAAGQVGAIAVGMRFVHVGGLAHFQLDGVYVVGRRAIVARDIAALEAAIDGPGVVGAGVQLCLDGGQDVGRAGGAVGRADVQVGQLAVEQTRQHAGDGMRFPQQHGAVLGLDTVDFSAQLRVIRLPVGLQALRAFGVGQHGVVLVERLSTEGLGGAQARLGLAGVQAFIVGRAVQIHHIARVARADHGSAQRLGKLVQRVQMPVGVAGLQAQGRHLRALRIGNLAAKMGNGDQQRGGATAEVKEVAQGKTPGHKMNARCGGLTGAAGGARQRRAVVAVPAIQLSSYARQRHPPRQLHQFNGC
ncbi:hypothetical protein D3C85_410000 [compost metagenome]